MQKRNKIILISLIVVGFIIILLSIILTIRLINENTNKSFKVNLTNLTYVDEKESHKIKIYKQENFNDFLNDYQKGNLPKVYITEFLFDGVSMYKTYDLDDFIQNGNDTLPKVLKITTVNINMTGKIELSGILSGGMIAINTNELKDDIKLILNGVNINTGALEVPAIYVYNQDINYTEHKVTISANKNTKNYLEGGSLKKISLMEKDKLDSYNENENPMYLKYSNYYGVYTSKEIDNILFAKVKDNSEDVQSESPYYYYKASGAISSDISLYFEGEGYLEVISKNSKGIETKGNLIFSGGIGDYVINAQDDCLNTDAILSENQNVLNTLTIDVKSLIASISKDTFDSNAIYSNGDLIINGGRIFALARSNQGAGLASGTGTFINGGTIIAAGDTYDEIKESSTQNFIYLSFNESINENDLISLIDNNDNVIFAYQTDRNYTNLIYSSNLLKDGIYTLYKGGVIDGKKINGFYSKITNYSKGEMLGYSTQINRSYNMDDMPNSDIQNDIINSELPDGVSQNSNDIIKFGKNTNIDENDIKPINKDFTIKDIANIFNGIGMYVSEES